MHVWSDDEWSLFVAVECTTHEWCTPSSSVTGCTTIPTRKAAQLPLPSNATVTLWRQVSAQRMTALMFVPSSLAVIDTDIGYHGITDNGPRLSSS